MITIFCHHFPSYHFHGHVVIMFKIQVLSRFEGFPTKKLEALRTATALYKKLDNILTELQNWKIAPPLDQLLDIVERYFNKVITLITHSSELGSDVFKFCTN